MIRRWCVYLAVLAGSMGLYGAFPGWATWIAVLTVAGSPLVSVAVSAIRREADALGLFRFPGRERPGEYVRELRPYRPGDSLSRVHWKLAAKTGALAVWEDREEALPGHCRPKPPMRRAVLPIGLCLAVLICIFPPGRYAQQMLSLRALLSQQPTARLDLMSAGPRTENKQAVLDVVASESQLLYLRGQAFDSYDGQSWSASGAQGWSVWQPKGTVTAAARRAQDVQLAAYGGQEQKPGKACLQLPRETKAWAAALAEGKTVGQIQALVRDCANYDENAPKMPENGDFVRWFVRESGRGYCVHFASAAVVLLRAAGIPARLVTGYVVDVQAGVRKTVVGSDAHAWAEYWDGGVWRILEATPTVAAAAVPEMPAEKESNAPNAILWALPGLAIFGFPLLLRRRRGDDPRQHRLKELKQKAAFSREGLTEEERREMNKLLLKA